ncbi:MAG: PilZ domain-containing protein [Planctomycetaceae bacterium]|nr:PilZ domain-containing protein [Planctomycetales bacterium]MCB9873836.1 PilZ domain-containing protein [Planctomycetaceae bacterium]MCB9941444.1 PilZ domain-containing protein [Planctomycetaceae bacterium]HRX78003.1 hypothetical protein [Pirellulaceae bacterium]
MLTRRYTVDELRSVRPEFITFDPATVQPVCTEMLEFAQRFGSRDGNNIEKRSAVRHPLVATLTAIELDEQLLPLGQPFQTICRNLSTGGICLINDRAIRRDLLALELKGAGGVPIQTVAHVLRRRPIGAYHDIGTEFVTKFANPKSAKRSEQ